MIGLIVAYDKNRVIGNRSSMPWKIPGEQKRFKELTLGNTVVMGKHTYEEIGHPLSNRFNIIVSSTMLYTANNCMTVSNLSEGLRLATTKDIYIAGGSRLYEEVLPYVEKMFITEIHIEVIGDTYFPYFNESDFIKEVNEHNNESVPYTYYTYTRK